MAQVIRTPDQRLRVFVSSTLGELAAERDAARRAVGKLRLAPVLFELGARPHPPRSLYRAYLEQSHIFLGIYWERYGWVAPGEEVSGLEDEYNLSGDRPKLVYIKEPAPAREERLSRLLDRIKAGDQVSYKRFGTVEELEDLIQGDLALLLSERFEAAAAPPPEPEPPPAPIGTPAPADPTPLVGRQREISEVAALLGRDDVRLVTLSGPGGIGKTRMAAAVMREVAPLFADGAVFVPLASARDSASVVAAILQACAVSEVAEAPPFASLAAALGPRRMLLVADNFEQALDAAAEMAALLAAAPLLKLLVTSRAVLRLRGEHEYPVPPLPLPEAAVFAEAERSEAVRLFVERARDVRPDFDLTPENAAAVSEVCRRLDGLPLAIELAAARVRLLPPAALLSRLDHSLALLTGGPRDLPDRQRTLRATVAWSYDLLSSDEALLFGRLAVFAGGFGLEAAEEICSLDGSIDVLEGLGGLADQSLLMRADIDMGEPRFALLETIREFAQERMAERGEETELRARHASYYLALAEAAEKELTGPQQVVWQAVLGRERDNLHQAMHWFERTESWPELARLAGALGRHWLITGEYSEGADWLQRALAHDEALDPRTRGKILSAAGVLGAVRRDPRAREMLERALALHPETGDERARASTLNVLGILADEEQDYEHATALFEESLTIFRELGEEGGMGAVLLNLAWVAVYQGDLTRAEQLAQEAHDISAKKGDVNRVTASLLDLGWVAFYGGRLDAAASYFVRAVEPARRLDDRLAIADVMDGLARVAAGRGRDERAVRLYAAAETLRRRLGTPLSPADQALFEEAVSASRERLGSGAFDALWTEGEALSEEEAVGEALCESSEQVRPA